MRYVIISYEEIGNDQDKHVFHAETKRQVVGLMKTVMDNFNPAHVDIVREFENGKGIEDN
jgi:hypothetical protein